MQTPEHTPEIDAANFESSSVHSHSEHSPNLRHANLGDCSCERLDRMVLRNSLENAAAAAAHGRISTAPLLFLTAFLCVRGIYHAGVRLPPAGAGCNVRSSQGRLTRKQDPPPARLSAVTWPPCSSTTVLTKYSPRPVPTIPAALLPR